MNEKIQMNIIANFNYKFQNLRMCKSNVTRAILREAKLLIRNQYVNKYLYLYIQIYFLCNNIPHSLIHGPESEQRQCVNSNHNRYETDVEQNFEEVDGQLGVE